MKGVHETVGWKFTNGGNAIYLCTRYEKAGGFWMKLIKGPDNWFPSRREGHETCVSERAIGRTYHLVDNQKHPSNYKHPSNCECYVCRGEDNLRQE